MYMCVCLYIFKAEVMSKYNICLFPYNLSTIVHLLEDHVQTLKNSKNKTIFFFKLLFHD